MSSDLNQVEHADPSTSAIIVKKLITGIAITVLIAVSWAGQIQFTKSSYTDPDFFAPFFLVWFSTLWMIFCYPVYFLGNTILTSIILKNPAGVNLGMKVRWNKDVTVFGSEGITFRSLVTRTFSFTTVWLLCNYAASQSLAHVSAVEFTVIFTCNSAIVFVLAFLVLHDPFTLIKGISIAFSIAGVVCVSYAQGFKIFTVIGVVCAVASAALAAVYKVFFKKVVGDAGLGQVSLFMTSIGLCNMLIFWPVMLALTLTNAEQLELHTAPWGFILGSSVLGFLFNFMINLGIAITYPLFVSIGMFVGIPLNTVIDLIARHETFNHLEIVGIVLIVISFIIILIPPELWTCGKKRSAEYNVVADTGIGYKSVEEDVVTGLKDKGSYQSGDNDNDLFKIQI